MDLLIKDITAVTMDDERPVLEHAYLGVTGRHIAYLGTEPPQEHAGRVLDGRGKVAMPGLINAHTHVPMALMRGFADDYALQEWLHSYVFPTEAKLDKACIELGSQLGMAECIRCGTTSITDMYFKIPTIASVAYQCGIKANLSNGATCFDREHYQFNEDTVTLEMREMLDQWHNRDNGRIRLDASIHAEYTSFDQVWRANAAFAREHSLNMHVHLSETALEHEECLDRYGKTPAQVLAEAGVFDTRASAAHCVFVSDSDMELLAEKGVTAVHNPVSNLKLGSGVARVSQMLERGVRVALGTDGMCSNNSGDLFEEIKLAALLQKGIKRNPSLVPAWQALKLATVGGAYAQGREAECGMLREGMDADLILLDFDAPHLQPVHHAVSSLCYSASGLDVCLTMVQGKILYENGQFTTIDWERIKHGLKSDVMPRVFGA